MTDRPDEQNRSAEVLDIDARFLLANERTLLAWTRTSLTFLVAGFGIQQFATDLRARWLVAVVLMLLGAVAAAAGFFRHMQADRAIRAGELPATGRTPLMIAAALAVISVAGIIAVIVGAAG